MRTFRLLTLSLTVTAHLGVMASPISALADSSPLKPEQLTPYRSMLSTAQSNQRNLESREACLMGQNADLQTKGNALEVRLGTLLSDRQPLSNELATKQSEMEGLVEEISYLSQRITDLEEEINPALRLQREFNEKIESCRGKFKVFSGFCDMGDAVGKAGISIADLGYKVNNLFRQMEDVQRQLGNAQENMAKTELTLRETRQRSDVLNQEIDDNKRSKRQIDAEIIGIKSTIEALYAAIQNHRSMIDKLKFLLEDAYQIDIDSPVGQEIELVSAQLNALTAQVPQLINFSNSALPEGVRQNCSSH